MANPLQQLMLALSGREKPQMEFNVGADPKELALSKLVDTSLNEDKIINSVAKEYGLTPEQTKLLWSIRKVEQGRQGREFGVLTPEAMRFENGDPIDSFTTQAKWAAGTIKKRYDGDIESFANRWAPVGAENDPTNLNKNWIKNIKYYMNKER